MALRQIYGSDRRAAAFGEMRAASAAGGGTALTTTAALVVLPDGTTQVQLLPRNLAGGATVVKFALVPYLAILRTDDSLATVTDESGDAQDGATGTVVALSDLDVAANGGYLFVGAPVPFRGVDVTIVAANANASVLTAKFRTASAWTAFTNGDHGYVDGTISAGKSMGQTGQVVWPTLPTTWVKRSLAEIGDPVPLMSIALRDEPLYWTRWEWSAQLDASVTASAMIALARSTAYAELVATLGYEARVSKGLGGHAAVEALTNAGTANLIVNVYADPGGSF